MDKAALTSQAKRLIFSSSRHAQGLFAGMYRSAFRGPGIEIEDVRHYVSGDDIRNIDWNVTARTGVLHSKKFREERELPVFILFDISGSMDYGSGSVTKRECAATAAALFSFAAAYNNDKVGAVLFSETIDKWVEPVRGSRHASRLTSDFLSFQPRGVGSNIDRAIKTVIGSTIKRGICFIISDFKSPVNSTLLSSLAAKHDLIAVYVYDSKEKLFPRVGFSAVKDQESGRTVFISTLSKKQDDQINRKFGLHEKNVAALKKTAPIEIIELQAGTDIFPILFHFFRRR